MEERGNESIKDLLDCELNLEYIVLSYCERIRDDDSLTKFFRNFDQGCLMALEKEILEASMLDIPHGSSTTTTSRERSERQQLLHGRVALSHHRLFEMGMDENHFDILQEHYLNALRDNWVREEVIKTCKDKFSTLRYIFEENANKHKMRKIDSLSDSMRLMAVQSKDVKDELSDSIRELTLEDVRLPEARQQARRGGSGSIGGDFRLREIQQALMQKYGGPTGAKSTKRTNTVRNRRIFTTRKLQRTRSH